MESGRKKPDEGVPAKAVHENKIREKNEVKMKRALLMLGEVFR
jgi:hypothetical protein